MADEPDILVVDDSDELRDLYSVWLAADYEVEAVPHGSAALEALEESVDIVLLDREMPGPSGLEVARIIEDSEYDPFVVMVSSLAPDFELVEYPVDDYLQKPVQQDELRDAVETCRAQREYLEAADELFALMAKVATVEAHHSEEDLAASDEYVRLKVRLEEKRTEVYEALLDAQSDWETAFRVVARDTGSLEAGSGEPGSIDASVDLPNGFG